MVGRTVMSALCPDDLLLRATRGPLAAGERLALDQHLGGCAICRMAIALHAAAGPLQDVDGEDEARGARAVERLLAPRLVPGAPRPDPSGPAWPVSAARPEAPPPAVSPWQAAAAASSARRAGVRRARPARRAIWVAAAALLLVASAASAGWWRYARLREDAASAIAPPAAPARAHAHRRGTAANAPTGAPLPEAPVPQPAPTPTAAPPPSNAGAEARPSPAAAGVAAPPVRPPAPAPRPGPGDLFREAAEARRQRDARRAVRIYRLLQSGYPRSDEAVLSHLSLGELYLGLGAPDAALEQFDAYLADGAADLGEEASVGKARALERLGRADDEHAAWQALLRRYPTSDYRWRAQERLRQLDEAMP
jgi:TolA-binding protein